MEEIKPKKNSYRSRIDDPGFYSRKENSIDRAVEFAIVLALAVAITFALILTLDHYELLNWVKL